SLLLAQSGHSKLAPQCPLLGVKRTLSVSPTTAGSGSFSLSLPILFLARPPFCRRRCLKRPISRLLLQIRLPVLGCGATFRIRRHRAGAFDTRPFPHLTAQRLVQKPMLFPPLITGRARRRPFPVLALPIDLRACA